MSILSKNKRKFSPQEVADAVPEALSHGADKAAQRVADVASEAGSRVAKSAGTVGDRASELSAQLAKSASTAGDRASDLGGQIGKARPKLLARRRPVGDAVLKAQLAKTSQELSKESAELRSSVDSLNAIIRASAKASRKAGARSRTRLIGGLAIGAVAAYHLDPQNGGQRRTATAQRVKSMVGSPSGSES